MLKSNLHKWLLEHQFYTINSYNRYNGFVLYFHVVIVDQIITVF